MNQPMRILQVLPALNYGGGIENYVMNYYRHIDREKFQFDFIIHTNLEISYESEINELGGRVFNLPIFNIRNLNVILKKIDNFFESHNEYVAVHCHMANASPFYFYSAKKHGIKHLILHSHQPSAADKFSHAIRNMPLLYWGNHLATDRVACSDLAGRFLFGNKSFIIIKNAINIQKFKFDVNIREEVRKELGVEGKFVIGHIGRLTAQKNQLFLLDIFKEVSNRKDNAILVMAGEGEDRKKIQDKVRQLNLEDKVKMLGVRSDANRLYQAFDYFVFPSLYEGLGIVLIEAQCAGLNVLTSSDNIPHEVKLTNYLDFLSLKDNPTKWADTILQNSRTSRNEDLMSIKQAGYDIYEEAEKLQHLYITLGS